MKVGRVNWEERAKQLTDEICDYFGVDQEDTEVFYEIYDMICYGFYNLAIVSDLEAIERG